MTIAEARRLLGVKTNYQLAKRLDIDVSTVSRWKSRRNNFVPPSRAAKIRALAGVS